VYTASFTKRFAEEFVRTGTARSCCRGIFVSWDQTDTVARYE
jgi:hypothetical protein